MHAYRKMTHKNTVASRFLAFRLVRRSRSIPVIKDGGAPGKTEHKEVVCTRKNIDVHLLLLYTPGVATCSTFSVRESAIGRGSPFYRMLYLTTHRLISVQLHILISQVISVISTTAPRFYFKQLHSNHVEFGY